METNKPERKNLSLGTTVSPMSNYIGKAPALSSGEGDSLLRLAKNLESYNPALKTLAEEHEKDLMEKGYAEAMEFAEETGELKEHQTLWNEFQAKNPEMTSFNPYLKRFLDGKTVESLTLERDNFMKLAYMQKGWAGLDSVGFQKAVEEENAAWYKANQGLINSLDSREVASKFDKSTQGMYASLNTEHLKAESEKVIKRRATALQNDTSFFIKDNLREITDDFNSNKVDIFHLSSQTEANNAALAGIVRDSNLMRNLNELLGNYENQGMTREEGVQTILATLKNHAVNNPEDADEMIVFGKEFAKDSPTISKEVMDTWGRETEEAAITEAKRQDINSFYQEALQEKQDLLHITKSINSLGWGKVSGKPAKEVASMFTMPDGSPVPVTYISHINTLLNSINEGTKYTETEANQAYYYQLLVDIKTGRKTPSPQEIIDDKNIHPNRFPALFKELEEAQNGGKTMKEIEQDLGLLKTAIFNTPLLNESVNGNNIKAITVWGQVLNAVEAEEKRHGRSMLSNERQVYGDKIFKDLLNTSVINSKTSNLKYPLLSSDEFNSTNKNITAIDIRNLLTTDKSFKDLMRQWRNTSFDPKELKSLYKQRGVELNDEDVVLETLYLKAAANEKAQNAEDNLRKDVGKDDAVYEYWD